ncbi:phosphatase PAP2 family protein [Rhodocytophaga rosea]|uniref:Phosphatase PAP2 family protein n=1 Tax=Rhodocytophaga rosea TaxID=2704465 RepID=A0A6C0GHT1_9BACT|nr:phosphatase PAP2 family protein [Rhodocytophaga rosea]QHT67507.1 phosphatase PAP2 family protein [Rhodocytophaga rosea]
MIKLFQRNTAFFLPYLFFLLIGAILQLLYSKEEIFLYINGNYHTAADYFFQYLTHIGDGVFYVGVILFLAAFSLRKALIALGCFISSSLFSQLLKKLVFLDELRPKAFFEHKNISLHTIEGLTVHSFNSFPSGHATTAFSVFCLLSILLKNKQMGYLWFVLALLAAYSRIYLSQHFFADVYAGSLIGVGTTLLVYYWLTIYFNKRDFPWQSKGFLDYIDERKKQAAK